MPGGGYDDFAIIPKGSNKMAKHSANVGVGTSCMVRHFVLCFKVYSHHIFVFYLDTKRNTDP
jgi:hypothetical protein